MERHKKLPYHVRKPPTTPLGIEINELHSHSPLPAADKLIDAFMRPPRLKPTLKQQAIINTSLTSTITISGIPIKVYAWNPPHTSHTVLLTHGYGYGTSVTSLLSFLPSLLASGVRVIACDHVGHGASGGDWADLNTSKETFLFLARMYAPIEAVIGHSVGATMALVGLIENSEVRVKKVVCLGAPTQFESVIGRFCAIMGVRKEVGVLAQSRMEERGTVLPGIVRSVVKKKMEKVDVGRLLVVQDRNDLVVGMEDAQWLAGHLANVRVEITEGHGHYRGLQDPKIVKVVTEFVLEGVHMLQKL